MRTDVATGMFFSNLIMFFIIAVGASVLAPNGITTIQTASDAALALRPFAGEYASLLFAIGIIGTGFLAVPILAGSASYALSESFKWKSGLHYSIRQARFFYAVILLSMVIGMSLNFVGIDPIKALLYSAIFNGLIAPIMLFFIVALSSKKKLMGEFANNKAASFFGWIATTGMFLVSVTSIVLMLQ